MNPQPEPLEVEMLATEDERRLEVAIAASRPIPADALDELIADLRRHQAEMPKPNRKAHR